MKKLFKHQELVQFDKEIAMLEREKMLEIKKRKEFEWQEKRHHFQLRQWARELLEGEVMDVFRMHGQEAENRMCSNLLMDMEVIQFSMMNNRVEKYQDQETFWNEKISRKGKETGTIPRWWTKK